MGKTGIWEITAISTRFSIILMLRVVIAYSYVVIISTFLCATMTLARDVE